MKMTTWWNDVEYLAEQSQRIENRNDDNEEWECGVNEDHDWKPGDLECRRCDTDLSDWNEEVE
jgi:hypothetical protein